MAIPKILYRTTDTPAQPSEISTSDAIKGQALSLEDGDWNFSQLQKLKANLDSGSMFFYANTMQRGQEC
jgi:hypothetical protein